MYKKLSFQVIPKKNPREECNVITLRSDKRLSKHFEDDENEKNQEEGESTITNERNEQLGS